MNVAALLQDSPSDDHEHRRRQQQRDRDLQQQQQQQQHQQQQAQQHPHQSPTQGRIYDRDRPAQPHPHTSPPHQHSQSSVAQSPRPSRYPSSPPPPHRPYPPPEYAQQNRAPPPPPSTSFLPPPHDYRRRSEPEPPRSHEYPGPPHHGPTTAMGHPGPPPTQFEHRPFPPPPRTHPPSYPHHPHHAQTQPNTPSSMYMALPSRPSPHGPPSAPPKLGLGVSPPGNMPPPGHGPIPLYPTPVGPGVPPSSNPPTRSMHSPHGYLEPSNTYGGHPSLNPQPHGLPPPPSTHHPGKYPSDYGRRSPVMGSLQRPPPFDDRDRDRDRGRDRDRDGDRGDRTQRDGGPGGPRPDPHAQPPSQMGGYSGSAHAPNSGVGPAMNARGPAPPTQTQMLSGPGAIGRNATFPMKERERERERDRMQERERDPLGGAIGESPEARRERERHYAKERERDRQRDREMDSARPREGPGMPDIDPEREWYQRTRGQHAPPMREQIGQEQGWPRFAPPRTPNQVVEDGRGREQRLMEMEREKERERERDRALVVDDIRREQERFIAEEAMRRRDAEWVAEKPGPLAPGGRLPAKEKAVREKEREREERRIVKTGSGREGQMEERERMMREQDMVWHSGPERDRERNERAQRERERERVDMDAMRGARIGQPQTSQHEHHRPSHPHHPHLAPVTKSAKHAAGSSSGPSIQTSIGPGMAPEGQLSFEQMQERHQQAQFAQGSSKMSDGQSQGPPLSSHGAPPPHRHQHPYGHLQHQYQHQTNHNPHVHPHLVGNVPPPGYQHRRTPPPGFAPPMAQTGSGPSGSVFTPPRSSSPRPVYAQQLVHLGTYIYPRSPFPYLDFPGTHPDATPVEQTREIHATILIPSGFLPTKRPAQPRIWGGALIPALPPIAPMLPHPYFIHPHPQELRGKRRVYTDDSDLFLCALHAGLITWSQTRRAKSEGKDLLIEVRITKEARFIGGFGSPYVKAMSHGRMMVDADPEDDGSTLLSAGWGNSHDGAGIEILAAALVQRGTARSAGLKNRAQRLKEYTDRRSVVCECARPPKKKRRLLTPGSAEDSDSPPPLEVEITDLDLCTTRTIVSGDGASWIAMKFKYEFPSAKASFKPAPSDVVAEDIVPDTHKRRRSSSPATISGTEPDIHPANTEPLPVEVVATDAEVRERNAELSAEPEKVNAVVPMADPPDESNSNLAVTTNSVEVSNSPSGG